MMSLAEDLLRDKALTLRREARLKTTGAVRTWEARCMRSLSCRNPKL